MLSTSTDLPGVAGRSVGFRRPLRHTMLTQFGKAAAGIWLAMERGRQRRALAALDDRALRDIGLTRMDVRHECAKPIWVR